MDRRMLLASASVAASILAWSTILAPRGGAVAHLVENATWALVGGAVVCALLATDGLQASARPALARALVAGGLVLAAVRGAVLFMT